MKDNKIISPVTCLIFGYLYIIVLAIIFHQFGFFRNHGFFSWGPPLFLFGTNINDQTTFYIIFMMYFLHQLINNWVNNATYPWIINNIQDPKCLNTGFSQKKALIIVNMFAFYSSLDLLLIIGCATSQISFFFAIVIANVITTTYINWQHIKEKEKSKELTPLI